MRNRSDRRWTTVLCATLCVGLVLLACAQTADAWPGFKNTKKKQTTPPNQLRKAKTPQPAGDRALRLNANRANRPPLIRSGMRGANGQAGIPDFRRARLNAFQGRPPGVVSITPQLPRQTANSQWATPARPNPNASFAGRGNGLAVPNRSNPAAPATRPIYDKVPPLPTAVAPRRTIESAKAAARPDIFQKIPSANMLRRKPVVYDRVPPLPTARSNTPKGAPIYGRLPGNDGRVAQPGTVLSAAQTRLQMQRGNVRVNQALPPPKDRPAFRISPQLTRSPELVLISRNGQAYRGRLGTPFEKMKARAADRAAQAGPQRAKPRTRAEQNQANLLYRQQAKTRLNQEYQQILARTQVTVPKRNTNFRMP